MRRFAATKRYLGGAVHTAVKRKIQRHFRFSPPRTLREFEKKTCETFVGKCYKNSTGRENYKLGVSEDVH